VLKAELEGSAMRVEFYYDLVSPYSYLAYGQLGRICEENGAALILRPMLLGAVHKEAGIKAPIETKLKARYQARDIRRWAEYYGVPLRFPDPFPFRTLKTMRAAMFLRKRGELEAFTAAAFALYWEESGAPKGFEEVEEDAPISAVARRMGAEPEEVLEGASSPGAKQDLKDATSEALHRGVFGAPAFFVGDEMFWGNDRLHFVEAALQE
jgi:2-hydroxychromene-2-carboxylate isomerase